MQKQNIQELLSMMDQGQSPFDSIVSGKGGGSSLPMMGGESPTGGASNKMPGNILGMDIDPSALAKAGGAPQAPQIGPDGKPVPSQTDRGQNPGISKFATQALAAMQNMIAESTDPQEIAAIRMIISLITRLMERDQKAQASRLTA